MNITKPLKSTAVAPANIAFVKYWGRTDDGSVLPANASLSMNLSECTTTTTVEFAEEFIEDQVFIDFDQKEFTRVEGSKLQKVVEQLDRIRALKKIQTKAKVCSKNTFPAGNGIASSASGFAALTIAGISALGLQLEEKELSILTRKSGSGSACRSIPDGFVQWNDGDDTSSYAQSIYPHDWWEIIDIVVVLDTSTKQVLSADGHKLAWSSVLYKSRLENLPKTLTSVNEALKTKDMKKLGEAIEAEALSMHAVMMTSTPPLLYWNGKTVKLIKALWQWRKDGVEAYFTIDAGSNVHLICEEKEKEKLIEKLRGFSGVIKTIINKPAMGARVIQKHLF